MAVAADASQDALHVEPSLDEVRALAREHNLVPLRHTFIDDLETPVSAFLKLRGSDPEFPAFLLPVDLNPGRFLLRILDLISSLGD